MLYQNLKGERPMRKMVNKLNQLMIQTNLKMAEKKEAVDQIIIMFIIIAVAAGVAGLLYIFGTGTLLPNFQEKINTLINNWFNHV